MMSMNLTDIPILNIKGAHYRCMISGNSKSEAINLMWNTDLTKHEMGKEILTFGNAEIEKNTFYCYESLIFLKDVDVDEVSNKLSFDEKNYKCFLGYIYNEYKVKPLHIMLPKTCA